MKTKNFIFLLIMLGVMAILRVQAQGPGFEWAVQTGGALDDRGQCLTIDASDNVINTGYFYGTVDFDPGAGVAELISNGAEDIYVRKLDAEGNLLWAFNVGGTSGDRGIFIASDIYGNIYVTGTFTTSMDADPGPGTCLLQCNSFAAFVMKVNPDGSLAWARQMGSPIDTGTANGFTVSVDASQNVYTAGHFSGTIDVDPGAGIVNFTASGNIDLFIQKLNSLGDYVWAGQITGSGLELAYSITTDAAGNVYTIGAFTGTTDFNPAKKASFKLTSKGYYDAFIQKMNPDGNFVWAKQMGGTQTDYGFSMALDAVGNIYATGSFEYTADFDPGTGIYNLTTFGMRDIFIEKLDANGSFQWVKQLGGADSQSSCTLALDAAGNIYITGYSYGTADFNPDPNATFYLTSEGQADVIIYKSEPDGDFLWAEKMGGTGYDFGISLALDGDGNIYSTGAFQDVVDFDPTGNGTEILTSGGDYDMFVQKLNAAGGDGCLVPAGLTAGNITQTTADLGWETVTGVTGYYVRYRMMGTSDWIVTADPVVTPPLSIADLTSATYYEFQVKTDCSSNWSYSGTFATLGELCVDVYEPNETIMASMEIPVSTDIYGSIFSTSDLDWFKFMTTSAAKNIMITLTDLPADYNIKLVTGTGQVLGQSQNTGTTPETIIYNTKKWGLYFLNVYGAAGAYNPNDCYTLRIDVSSTSYKAGEAEAPAQPEDIGISVYPNPTISAFNISIGTGSEEPVTLQLFDISGRMVQEFTSLSPDQVITIGEQLEAGVYLAVITQGQDRNIVKITKTR